MSLTNTCMELLEFINNLEQIIVKQNEMITKLVNENAELTNTVNEVMKLPY
ncbi:hypothetical protein HNQ94_000392 [Salirhabdus euzebyi]|uniref:Uncharacterized protein n=1 Tax=Salirhabdus euzebyi TaxID=394506 RepID=A0A841PYF0_9BACI|nr:hypothetical protein [Salirhabdus euzebyi]MBB6451971.1 hypothetical protein [Salirhabdus euzebyi]